MVTFFFCCCSRGGAASLNSPRIVITGTQFDDNVADDDGGALWTDTNSTMMEHVEVSGACS